MFEEQDKINEFDLMMKSILDEGQEDVPARVWDAVSEGLDNAARRRTVVLWFRRAAVGVAAAAAIVIGVIFNIKPQDTLVPLSEDSGLIAVVEPEEEIIEGTAVPDNIEISIAEAKPVRKATVPATEEIIPQTASEAMEMSETEQLIETENIDRSTVEGKTETDCRETQVTDAYFPEDWGEDEKTEKRDISLMLSGLASTNSTQSRNRLGLMKAPTITSAPQKTGVTETSTNSTYGLPVSFGVGVKIGLSDRWSVGVGANYSILTRQFYGKYTDVDKNIDIHSDIRNTLHYIGIPLNAYYDIVNKDRVNLYAYAGGTVEKCVADAYHVLSDSIYHRDNVDGMQLSANVGFGVEFMLGKHLGLYIDPSVRYYFDCNQPKSIRTVQPLMFGFEMGLRARL